MDDKSFAGFESDALAIDLRGEPVEQVASLLDLVRFDCFLDYVYSILFKRAPDREGGVHYQALARKGMSRSTIVRRLLRSREFRLSSSDAPGLGIDDFVNRVYQDVLGRWPDQDGLDTYRRIASRRGGRKKAIANLLKSEEALRKGGGRLARIEGLRTYAAAGWPTRLPVLGHWFVKQRGRRRRLDQMALNQRMMARQIADLRRDFDDADLAHGASFGFLPDTPSSDVADIVFQHALTRVRRER